MWAVLSAAVRYLLGLVFSAGAIKALAVGAMFFLLSAVVSIALGLIDSSGPNSAASLVSGLPADFLFYLDLLQADIGLTMCIAALATRFAIRRIPVIG